MKIKIPVVLLVISVAIITLVTSLEHMSDGYDNILEPIMLGITTAVKAMSFEQLLYATDIHDNRIFAYAYNILLLTTPFLTCYVLFRFIRDIYYKIFKNPITTDDATVIFGFNENTRRAISNKAEDEAYYIFTDGDVADTMVSSYLSEKVQIVKLLSYNNLSGQLDSLLSKRKLSSVSNIVLMEEESTKNILLLFELTGGNLLDDWKSKMASRKIHVVSNNDGLEDLAIGFHDLFKQGSKDELVATIGNGCDAGNMDQLQQMQQNGIDIEIIDLEMIRLHALFSSKDSSLLKTKKAQLKEDKDNYQMRVVIIGSGPLVVKSMKYIANAGILSPDNLIQFDLFGLTKSEFNREFVSHFHSVFRFESEINDIGEYKVETCTFRDLDGELRFNFYSGIDSSVKFVESVLGQVPQKGQKKNSLDYIMLLSEEPQENLASLKEMQTLLRQEHFDHPDIGSVPIAIHLNAADEITRRIGKDDSVFASVFPLMSDDLLYCIDNICDDNLERALHLYHDRYEQVASGKKDSIAGGSWSKLSYHDKKSNRFSFYHQPSKKFCLDVLAGDDPDLLEKIKGELEVCTAKLTTCELSGDIAIMQAVEHRRWNYFMAMNGFRPYEYDYECIQSDNNDNEFDRILKDVKKNQDKKLKDVIKEYELLMACHFLLVTNKELLNLVENQEGFLSEAKFDALRDYYQSRISYSAKYDLVPFLISAELVPGNDSSDNVES